MIGPGSTGSREIAIFWDYENVPLPENCHAAEVSKCIHNAVAKYGRIVDRRLYSDSRKWNIGLSTTNRRFLDSSGFDLVDTPSKGQKETIDKKMIADILSFAWDCAVRNDAGIKPCVVLITSDGDYAYTLSKLRDRGVMSVVFYGRQCTVAQVLVDTADVALSFEKDILASIKRDDPVLPCKASREASAEETCAFQEVSGRDVDDEILIFCKGVHSVQLAVKKKGIGINLPIDEYWATDLHVGGHFKKLTHSSEFESGRIGADKQRYQQVRFQAISRGLVQAGRRIINSSTTVKEVIPVVWDDNAGKREWLSSEVYLRLTEEGKSYFAAFESSLSASKSRQSESIQSDSTLQSSDAEYLGPIGSIVGRSHVADDDDLISSLTGEKTDIASIPASSGQNIPSEEDLVLFCQCVHKIRTIVFSDDIWATDASVAESYRKYDAKIPYKDIRELAITKFLVDVGRRDRAEKFKDMVLVSWSENAGRRPGLSDEIYLRLTVEGVKLISSFLLSSTRLPAPDEHTNLKGDGSNASTTTRATEVANIGKKYMWPTSQGSSFISEDTECVYLCKPESTTAAGNSKSQEATLSPEEGSLIFCKCVKSLQITAMKNNDGNDFTSYWVTDSTIAAHFRNGASALTNAKVTSKDYKSARDKSIEDGLVEAGRRLLGQVGSRNIVSVNWQENAGKRDGLASEVYLRLKKNGISRIKHLHPTKTESEVHSMRTQDESKKGVIFSSAPTAVDSSDPPVRKGIESGYISCQDESAGISVSPRRDVKYDDLRERLSHGQLRGDWNSNIVVRSLDDAPNQGDQSGRQGRSLFDRKTAGQYSSRDMPPRGNTATSRLIGATQFTECIDHNTGTDNAARTSTSEPSLLPVQMPTKFIDDSVTFLSCITAAQLKSIEKEKGASQTSDSWATDSAVAALFFEAIPSTFAVDRATLKQRYKKVRDLQINEGLVVLGRRQKCGDNKVTQTGTSEESDEHFPELYLRLTESGWSVVALSQSIPFPGIMRFAT